MALARTNLNPDDQIRAMLVYDDSIAAGIGMEAAGQTVEDNLHSIISQINRLMSGTVAGNNWYQDTVAPSGLGDAGAQRGVNSLNSDLHLIERKRILKRVSMVGLNAGSGVTIASNGDQFVILAGTEIPSTTTAAVGAVTSLGTVVADASGSFGTAGLGEVAGANALQPKNLLILTDASTGDVVVRGDGRQIYGLLQSENATDGFTITGTTPDRVQISFVVHNSDNTDLELITAGDMDGIGFNYAFVRRDAFEACPEEAWLGDGFADTGVANATRQASYDNQGSTPVDTTTNAVLDVGAGLSWELGDAASAPLFTISEDSGGGGTDLAVGSDVDTYNNNAIDVNFDNGVTVDNGSNAINLGVTADQIDFTANGTLTASSASTVTVTADSANASLTTTTSGNVVINSAGNVTSTAAGTTDLDGAGAVSINSTGGALNLGNDADAQAINVGTGAAARTITIGNATGATAVDFDSGTGAFSFDSTTADTSALMDLTTTGTGGDSVGLFVGASSPDGRVTGAVGSLFVDGTNGALWQNSDGATDWVQFDAAGATNLSSAVNAQAGTAFTAGAFDTQWGISDGQSLEFGDSTNVGILTVSAAAAGDSVTVDLAETAGGATLDVTDGTNSLFTVTANTGGDSATFANLDTFSATTASALSLSAGTELDLTSTGLMDVNAGANLDVDVTGTFDMLSTGAFSIDGTGASNISSDSGSLSVSATTTGSVLVDGVDGVEINSSGGALNLGNDADAQAINIGTGAAARTITVGNATGATAVALDAGTGAFSLDSTVGGDAALMTLTTTGADGDSVEVFVSDLDPSAAAGVAAPVGSVLHRDSGGAGTAGEMWVKTGAADTAWEIVIVGAAGQETLQEAYEFGNTIDVTSAEGTIDFSNTTDSDTTAVLTLAKTATVATGGEVLTASNDSNSTGNLASFTNAGSADGVAVSNTGSGEGITVDNSTGTGNALRVFDGGDDLLTISAAGATTINGANNQNITIATAGTGDFDVNSTNAVTLDAGSASNFSVASANLTLETTTSGTLALQGADAVDIDATGDSADVTVDAGDSASTTGGSVTVNAGDGGLANAGGAVDLTAGAAGTTAIGGAITLTGGAGGTVSGAGGRADIFGGDATDGAGGVAALTGGAAGGNNAGGAAGVTGGAGSGTGDGGSVVLFSGAAGATGNGGAVQLTATDGGATSGDGGLVSIASGNGGTEGDGGDITVSAGDGAGTDMDGGGITMSSGAGTGTGTGGNFIIVSGESDPTDGDAGDVFISGANGFDNAGNVFISAGSSAGGGHGRTVIQIASSGVAPGGTVSDADEVLRLLNAGTNGGQSNVYLTDQTPVGNILANPGSLAIREDTTSSAIYIHVGAATNDTDWEQLATGAATLEGAWASNTGVTTTLQNSFTGQVSDTDTYLVQSETGTHNLLSLAAVSGADVVTLGHANEASVVNIDSGTGGTDIDSTGAVTVDAAAASNFTVAGAALTLETTGTANTVVQSDDFVVIGSQESTGVAFAGGVALLTNGVAATIPGLGFDSLATSTDSGLLGMVTGQTSGTGNSGALTMNTGEAAGSGVSGNIGIGTGENSGTGDSGNLNMGTGVTADGDSGDVVLSSGSSTNGGSGTVSLSTGAANNGASGTLALSTSSADTTGNITLTTGDGDDSAGGILLTAGDVSGDAMGAPIQGTAGNVAGSGNGGAITWTTGDSGDSGAGGAYTVTTGDGGATTGGAGGNVTFTLGDAQAGNSAGGAFAVSGGAGFGTGDGGTLDLDGGTGGATGAGGSLTLTGGAGGATSGDGGSVTFVPGATNSGTDGVVGVDSSLGLSTPVFRLDRADGTSGVAVDLFNGSVDPESNVTANQGDVYFRDGGASGNEVIYVKGTGDASNTGWVALAAAAATVTRQHFQTTMAATVSPGNTITDADVTGTLPAKPASGFTFDTDAEIYLNGVLLYNGTGNEVTSGTGDNIDVEATGPTFNTNDVITIIYYTNSTAG